MVFHSPDGTITTDRLIDGLVDDTTIGTNTSGDNTTCLEEAQDLAQMWEHLLFLSGGTLARDKCFFYHLDWEWENGKARLIDPRDPALSYLRETKSQTCLSTGRCQMRRIGPLGPYHSQRVMDWRTQDLEIKSLKVHQQAHIGKSLHWRGAASLLYHVPFEHALFGGYHMDVMAAMQRDTKDSKASMAQCFQIQQALSSSSCIRTKEMGGTGYVPSFSQTRSTRTIYLFRSGEKWLRGREDSPCRAGILSFDSGFRRVSFFASIEKSKSYLCRGGLFSHLHDFMREFDISIVLLTKPYMQKKCVFDQALMSTLADN